MAQSYNSGLCPVCGKECLSISQHVEQEHTDLGVIWTGDSLEPADRCNYGEEPEAAAPPVETEEGGALVEVGSDLPAPEKPGLRSIPNAKADWKNFLRSPWVWLGVLGLIALTHPGNETEKKEEEE